MHIFESRIEKAAWEVERGGSQVLGYPELPREVEANLGYMRPIFIKREKNKRKIRTIYSYHCLLSFVPTEYPVSIFSSSWHIYNHCTFKIIRTDTL